MNHNQISQTMINQQLSLMTQMPQNNLENQTNSQDLVQHQNSNLVDQKSNSFMNMITNNLEDKSINMANILNDHQVKLTTKRKATENFDPTLAFNLNSRDSSSESETSNNMLNLQRDNPKPITNMYLDNQSKVNPNLLRINIGDQNKLQPPLSP